MTNKNKIDLLSLTLDEMMWMVKGWNWSSYRGGQIFEWLHKKLVFEIDLFTNLSQQYREILAEQTKIQMPQVVDQVQSEDGKTIKFLLKLPDEQTVETVLMLYDRVDSRDRATCCISTQSGCAMDCAFCATGKNGPGRNLTVAEIISQVLLASRLARQKGYDAVTNVVYMGMGEPLANLEAVKKSLLILNEEKGQNIGMRRMTVSTCGLVRQIYQLADWGRQVELAISLHAPTDELRAQLMPIAAKYPLDELLSACRYYRSLTGRRITFEYALFKGINDSLEQARQLGRLLARENALVNVITANPVPETGFVPSEVETVKDFCRILETFGLAVQRRESRGLEIDAACGQLSGKQQEARLI